MKFVHRQDQITPRIFNDKHGRLFECIGRIWLQKGWSNFLMWRLWKSCICPIQKVHTIGPDLEACANLLQQVYTSEHETKYAEHFTIPLFSTGELEHGLKCMQKSRCADTDGILLEMFLYSGENNLQTLLECLNEVLLSGSIPSSWCDIFSLLHKGGSDHDANNWRPIAILSITYNFFSLFTYQRIRHQLDTH